MSYSNQDPCLCKPKIWSQITWKSLEVQIDKRTKAVEEKEEIAALLEKLALSRKITFLKRRNLITRVSKSQLNKQLTREISRERRVWTKFKISIAKFIIIIIQRLIVRTILSTPLALAQCSKLTIWIKIKRKQGCNIRNLDPSKEFHLRKMYEGNLGIELW